jgi:hypothetical protein
VEICGNPIPLWGDDKRQEFRAEHSEIVRPAG